VHDITDLERRGIPGVFVASAPFADAAQAQGDRLGFHPAGVIVEHPIQDRTDEEMHAIADSAIDRLVAALTGQPQ
jgi:hypothetical protein